MIDVRVTGGGTISNGQLELDSNAVARCSQCQRDVAATAALAEGATACAACLRERLDALSVARFRLAETGASTGSLPWGKVTG